jgi:hypothetical protein
MSVVIVGAGPNLGAAVARRFGAEGLPVGLVSRNREKLEALARELENEGIRADLEPADIRDATALAAAVSSLAERLGPVEVLEYSPLPAKEFMKPILETTADDVRGPLEFSVLGGGRAGVGISFAGEVAYATPSGATSRSGSASTERRLCRMRRSALTESRKERVRGGARGKPRPHR